MSATTEKHDIHSEREGQEALSAKKDYIIRKMTSMSETQFDLFIQNLLEILAQEP